MFLPGFDVLHWFCVVCYQAINKQASEALLFFLLCLVGSAVVLPFGWVGYSRREKKRGKEKS